MSKEETNIKQRITEVNVVFIAVLNATYPAEVQGAIVLIAEIRQITLREIV